MDSRETLNQLLSGREAARMRISKEQSGSTMARSDQAAFSLFLDFWNLNFRAGNISSLMASGLGATRRQQTQQTAELYQRLNRPPGEGPGYGRS